MELKGKRVVVTGGAGFIGSHVVDALCAKGNDVTVLDNFSTGKRENLAAAAKTGRVTVVDCDVRNREAIEDGLRGAQVVFHLAVECVRLSLGQPASNHDTNATGTLNTLLAAHKHRVGRFIYCSSSEVYGNGGAGGAPGLLDERSEKLPSTIYGASKLAGEHYTLAMRETYGLETVVVRPFNSFGPRAHTTGPFAEVIPRFCIALLAGSAPVIFGDGQQTRDFTYVTDTAAGILAAAECRDLTGDSVNLSAEREISVVTLAQTLAKVIGKAIEPRFIEARPGEIRRLASKGDKARRLLSWKPAVTFEEGLERYLRWWRESGADVVTLSAEMKERNW